MRVVDGDTLVLMIDLGFNILHKITVRLLDIDTPELRGAERPDGLLAKQFVENWIHDISSTGLEWPLVVTTSKTGKYGRWLADIQPTDLLRPTLVTALKDAGFDWSDR